MKATGSSAPTRFPPGKKKKKKPDRSALGDAVRDMGEKSGADISFVILRGR